MKEPSARWHPDPFVDESMMTRFATKFVCLSAVVMAGQLAVLTSTADAQCLSSALNVPMWEIYGMNPYQPRVRSPQNFSPLQSQIAQACTVCWQGSTLIETACAASADEIHLCCVSGADVTETSNSDAMVMIEGNLIKGEAAPSKEASISSPSDIVVAPPKSVEPTPAAIPSSEMKSELERARNEVKRLKDELSEAHEKARISAERAYAAEKAATAKGKQSK